MARQPSQIIDIAAHRIWKDPPKKLTATLVRNAPAPTTGYKITYDAEVKGFGIRVTAAGARSFVLRYRRRNDGEDRTFTIGGFPEWSVAAARKKAQRLKRQVDDGGDPVGEQSQERHSPTVNELCDRFVKEHLPKKRASTQIDYHSMIKCHVRPGLGRKKVASLAFEQVDALHRAITEQSGPYRANRVVALLSKMCSLAIKWRMRSDNPCSGIERNHEDKRKRYLTPPELKRLMHALAEHEDQDAADIFRILLLTGSRRGEVLKARWQDFDLDGGTWTKPGSTTKTHTTHVVPLSKPVIALLKGRKQSGEYVFSGRGAEHRIDVKSNWARVCKAAKISGLRPHDLRHSHASALVNAGVGLPVIGALLGHSNVATTARYAHLFDQTKRAAAEQVGAAIAGEAPPAK